MSEKQLNLTANGQQIQTDDINLLGETSGLSDDRVLAELLRIAPGNGTTATKGILTASAGTLIAPNGASGTILLAPFRAFVGSRTAPATEARKSYRDIRSALSVAEGAVVLTSSITVAANASGNPRWDLIYAAVSVDANSATVSRKVKDPTTSVITTTSVVVTKVQSIVLSILPGTAAASPVWPAAPTDTGSTYYIALGYVRVPNGFNATATVLPGDIATTANCLRLSEEIGAKAVSFADFGGLALAITVAQQQSWGSTGTRPETYLPTSAVGGSTIVVPLNLKATTGLVTGTVIDSSRDWSKRLVRWTAHVDPSTDSFAFSPTGTKGIPSATLTSVVSGQGHTYTTSGAVVILSSSATLGGTAASIKIDGSTGALVLSFTGTTDCKMVLWIDLSSQIENT